MSFGPGRVLCFAALSALSSCASVSLLDEELHEETPERGVIVSEHPLATAAGVEILDAGGNAADAAIATALALAVVFPQAGNLGGGGFALWVPHEGKPAALDFRETAPAGFGPELYLDDDGRVVASRSLATPLAVGVPGTPAGLFELFRQFGSGNLRFAQLAQPAMRLAERGFIVDAWLARDLRGASQRARLEADPFSRALFYPGGEPLAEGARLVQRDLADTIRRLATRGPAAFYGGEIARKITLALEATDLRQNRVTRGRGMTVADLEGYRVLQREPIVGWFRGDQVIGMPPPSSGGIVVQQVLSILQGLPLDADRRAALERDPSGNGLTAQGVHWWIEALRRAFADRAVHLGDPDFHAVPARRLLSPDWIAERRVSIGATADHDVAAFALTPTPEPTQTTHLSAIDRNGNAVSLTTTLNGTFGSGILVPGAGFLLNNELDDFSILAGTPNMFGLVGSEANQLAPGKRPLSSMAPTIVKAGGRRVSLVIGSPGGPRIITSVIQTLLRVLVYGEPLEAAVRAPRLHQQWRPAETRFELGWPEELLDTLADDHGHRLREPESKTFGSVQAIWVGADGVAVGVSDPRRGGAVGAQGRDVTEAARPDDLLR